MFLQILVLFLKKENASPTIPPIRISPAGKRFTSALSLSSVSPTAVPMLRQRSRVVLFPGAVLLYTDVILFPVKSCFCPKGRLLRTSVYCTQWSPFWQYAIGTKLCQNRTLFLPNYQYPVPVWRIEYQIWASKACSWKEPPGFSGWFLSWLKNS